MIQEPRVISVVEAGRLLGIGRTTAYELARSGELPGVIKLGSRFRVSTVQLNKVLEDGSRGVVDVNHDFE